MKKKYWLGAIILLILAAAAAGFAIHNAAGDDTPTQLPGAVHPGEEREVEPGEAGSDGQNGRDEGKTKEYEMHWAEGNLIGRIDSHSLEIEVEGKTKVFGLSDALREKEFARGEISFEFYVDETGRSIITTAKFQGQRQGEVYTAEGIFNGLADSHTAEIEINGEPMAFGLDAGISFTGFAEGDRIFIAYQENEQGRLEIIKIEKIF